MSPSSQPPKNPRRGIVGDIHRARDGAAASADELRDFIGQMRGRSPQEMLGMVAGSDLVRATFMATAISVVFVAVFTVGPYLWNKNAKHDQPVAAPAAVPASPAAQPKASGSQSPQVAGSAVAVPPAAAPGASGPPDPLSPLGVNEAKSADPNKNPLINKNDDLLKDIGK